MKLKGPFLFTKEFESMKKELEGKDRKPRYLIIDVMRGVAVLLMIIFHIAFDLNTFGFVSIDFFENVFWFFFPRFIVALFLVCVGVSLALVHKDGIRWVLVRKRFYKIGGWALVISAVTYVLFPKHFVYFGILHCISRPAHGDFQCYLSADPVAPFKVDEREPNGLHSVLPLFRDRTYRHFFGIHQFPSDPNKTASSDAAIGDHGTAFT